MTTKPDELRELADELDKRAWRPDSKGDPECFDELEARSADALRDYAAALDRAGVTDEVVIRAVEQFYGPCKADDPKDTLAFRNMRAALESAALALQPDAKLRALVEKWRKDARAYSEPAMSVCADELEFIIGSKP